ncbi:MAG: hypothetical protein KUG79_18300 [Pseudomonadales bacterium]|nr:hypothetical protein [Pseudomonadales bacterium]
MKNKRSGIFYVKNPTGVVVLNKGIEIARYDSVESFVEEHQAGLLAIQDRQDKLEQAIAAQYDPLLKSPD